jgi:hypothetical protein
VWAVWDGERRTGTSLGGTGGCEQTQEARARRDGREAPR